MLILALETSTELGSCALWRDGVVTALHVAPGERIEAADLLLELS